MYEMISKVKKTGFKMLRFLMGWSERKTKRHLKKLLKYGLVQKAEGCEMCGNEEPFYFPTPWYELINWNEFFKEDDGDDDVPDWVMCGGSD